MDTIALKRTGGANVIVVEGDVTRQAVEAVVNSANESLQHNEGVATAMVRTGGRVIQEESDTWIRENGPVAPGGVAVTTGGMLQASHIIHAVGPYFDEGSSDPVLAAAVMKALDAAADHGLRSIAFPLISSGLRGYPAPRAAEVMTAAVREWLSDHADTLTEIRLVGFSRNHAELLATALNAD